jgi:hypothetical protein
MWKAEKQLYSQAPRPIQWGIGQIYMAALLARQTLSGKTRSLTFGAILKCAG